MAYFACDVTDPKAVIATHKAVVERFGAVDILVNNAGQSAAKPFTQISDEEWQADLDLKLMAAVRLTRLVWPAMQAQKWGRVINLLNVYAKTPDANTAPTSISRAAGMALTKVLSAEGAADNILVILVNALLIGFPRKRSNTPPPQESPAAWVLYHRKYGWRFEGGVRMHIEEFIAKAGERLPMGRMGRAEECADLALFLASERGSYITGCAINMDGGLSKGGLTPSAHIYQYER